ncbi:MAG TPA: hypothetical protein VG960_13450 [Caulobacteraceae bacterium]|nr:hypothetical protein [Caulobacteraceae bacterium]
MSLDTYDGLKAEIAAWLRRSDLTSEIPGFIALAEAHMNRRLRVRPMTVRLAQTWDTEYVALPADFLSERLVKLTSGGLTVLRYLTPEEMDARAATGRPQFYGLYGGELRLHPAPDQAYGGELVYLQAVPALSDSNPSNWLLASHPDAYLYGALTQSAPYLRADERLQTWTALFGAVLTDIETADRAGAAAKLHTDAPIAVGERFDIIRG